VFTKIHLKYKVKGQDISPQAVESAIKLWRKILLRRWNAAKNYTYHVVFWNYIRIDQHYKIRLSAPPRRCARKLQFDALKGSSPYLNPFCSCLSTHVQGR
jgi:hypothetical protein